MRIMSRATKCFVPGCRSGYESDRKKRKAMGLKSPSLFQPPRDKNKLKLWNIAIKRADRELTPNDKVCELHFLPEQISRYYVHTDMPDGAVVYLEKGCARLLPDAVPSVFPNYPDYLNKNIKREPPCKKMPLSKKTKKGNAEANETTTINDDDKVPQFSFKDDPAIIDDDDKTPLFTSTDKITITNTNDKLPQFTSEDKITIIDTNNKLKQLTSMDKITLIDTNDNLSQFTFNNLLENVSNISKPHKLWAVSSHENFIMCVKWDSSFLPERQIVIDTDLNFKVFYYGTESHVRPNIIINSVESTSLLIKKVHRYIVCAGATKFGNESCTVYVENELTAYGRPHKWCNLCKQKSKKDKILQALQ